MSSPRYAIGLDLGDGESAIAWADRERPGRIRLYDRGGDETSVVTAIARTEREKVIGERALRLPEARQVLTSFKTMPVRTGVGLVEPLDSVEFAVAFVAEFAERHPDIAAPDNCVIYVGHPAGWPRESVGIYREQLEAALRPFEVRLVPESQSAFLHVHDEAKVAVDIRPALVVDAGSSTTDFTLVTDVAENLPFGEELGCRVIDEQLAARVTAAVPDPYDRARLAQSAENALLRWLCRRHKEAAFAGVDIREPAAQDSEWVAGTCWPTLSRIDVEAVVNEPGGLRERFRDELRRVRDHLGDRLPKLVLTTGGGSRMPFVRELCAETFPNATVDPVDEPSLAVARGLASYGRWRARVDAFRAGVSGLADSSAVDGVMAGEAKPLAERLFHVWINWSLQFTKREFDEVLDGVRASGDSTDLQTRQQLFAAWLATPDGREKRERILGPLETKLRRALTPGAETLCRAGGLDAAALETKLALPPSVFVRPRVSVLKNVDEVFDKTGGQLLDLIAGTSAGRMTLRFFDRMLPPSVDRALNGASNALAANLYRLSDDDIATLTAAVREQVREELLQRAKEIERLLA